MNRLEKAIVGTMKAQALANAMEDLYTEEWKKLGTRGKYAVDLLLTLRDVIDEIGTDLDAYINDVE